LRHAQSSTARHRIESSFDAVAGDNFTKAQNRVIADENREPRQ
jgi:hypothetical protein